MAASGYRNILIKAANPFGAMRAERIAAEAVTPGELLELDASREVQAHSTGAGSVGAKWVCLESPHVDNPGTDAIDTNYAVGDTVYVANAQPGEEYYMWLAGSQNVSEGDLLESDGTGALRATTGTGVRAVVAEAGEDNDNSSNGSRVRIVARIV